MLETMIVILVIRSPLSSSYLLGMYFLLSIQYASMYIRNEEVIRDTISIIVALTT